MTRLYSSLVPLSLAFAVFAAPAGAQSVGMQVTDSTGAAVGTVTAVKGDTVVVKTDKHEVTLPKTSFTPNVGKLLFGMTQAQLNAAVEQAEAAAAQAFQVGAVLHDNTGAVVGPVTALDAESATVQIDANVVRVPRAALQPGHGGLVVNLTRAQLQAASVPAAAPAPAQ